VGTQILVVGADAMDALDDLAAVPGLTITRAPSRSVEPHKSLDPETITALVTGVVGSAASVAQLVMDWRARHRSDGSSVEGVVIERDGYRVSLDGIGVDELARLLGKIDPGGGTG